MSFQFSVTLLEEVDAKAVIEGQRAAVSAVLEAPRGTLGFNTSFAAAGLIIDLLQALAADPGGDVDSALDLFVGGRMVEAEYEDGVHLLDPRQVQALVAALAPLDLESAPGLVDATVQRSVLTPRELEDLADELGELPEELAELAEFVRTSARDGLWLMTTAS